MVPYSCKKIEWSLSILSKSIQSTLNICLSVLKWWGMSSKPCNKLHQICTKERFVEWTIKLDIHEWLIHKSRQMIGTSFLIPARELKDPSNDLARCRKAFQALGTHASPYLGDEVMSSKNCTKIHCPHVRIHRMCTKDRIGTCGRIEACISNHSTLGGPSKRLGPWTCMELSSVWMRINQTDMQNSWNQCKKVRTDLESGRKGREAWDSRTWAAGGDAEAELRVYLLPSHLEWPPTPFLLPGWPAAPPAQPLCHLAASPSEWDLRRFWCFPIAYTPAWLRMRHPSSPFLHTMEQMSPFVPVCEYSFTRQRVSSSLKCARRYQSHIKIKRSWKVLTSLPLIVGACKRQIEKLFL